MEPRYIDANALIESLSPDPILCPGCPEPENLGEFIQWLDTAPTADVVEAVRYGETGDYISRQAAIDALKEELYSVEDDYDEGFEAGIKKAIWVVEKWLPSADIEEDLDNAYAHGHTAAEAKYRDALRGWIPVTERLPMTNGCYLVWRPHFFHGVLGMSAICYFDGQDTWHDSYGVDFERTLAPEDVAAWMPLPEPYKEESNV